MSIKPILFNTDMVRAILDGRKTVTRRVVKPQPETFYVNGERRDIVNKNEIVFKVMAKGGKDCYTLPPYQPGDIIYVRETWHKYIKRVGKGEDCHLTEFYGYKASVKNSEDSNTPWKPSIHMPKEAARIWLKVTNVQVERLQDITEEQAKTEGENSLKYDSETKEELSAALDWFPVTWDSTIKKSDIDRYGWNANPWVFVIEFERCEKPQEVEQFTTKHKVEFIARHHGFESQSRQCMEECGELSQAVNKVWRSVKGFVKGSGKSIEVVEAEANLIEEMADVSVMIMQLQELLGISNSRLKDAIEFKLDREIQKIHNERRTEQ